MSWNTGLPGIEVDGKLTTVQLSDMTLWFSYQTMVAFQVGGEKVVMENQWSNTTGKHINQIDGGDKASRVSSTVFVAKWKELTGKPLPKPAAGLFGPSPMLIVPR